MTIATTLLRAPPPIDARQALFLDLDGTLAPFADTPDGVGPDPRRTQVVRALVRRMSGAVAILSGRTLPQIDRILQHACMAAAGVHGLARRTGDGRVVTFAPSVGLHRAKGMLAALVQASPGLLLEDKGHSLALHYRNAPGAADAVREAVDRLAAAPDLVRQDGEMVCELRTAGPDKGQALRTFLAEAPFRGRAPVAVGDDLTDEHAFAAAEEMGGYGVLVGSRPVSAARYRLGGVDEVLAWLQAEAA